VITGVVKETNEVVARQMLDSKRVLERLEQIEQITGTVSGRGEDHQGRDRETDGYCGAAFGDDGKNPGTDEGDCGQDCGGMCLVLEGA
jgi:hypothetical protein